MKIAVTSMGPNLMAEVDPRFGRASYILIIDSETFEFEVVDNQQNVQAFKGAGIQTATTVSNRGAKALLTGYCGPNAYTTLQAAGIRVVNDVSGTVQDALKAFNSGAYVYSETANVEGHW